MSKQLVLMQGPFNTRSGYGDHARSLFYALNDSKKYDIVLVPSEHSKASIVNTIYDQVNNMPDGTTQKVGEKKVTKPVKVLFEGAEDDIFNVIKPTEIEKGFFDYINDMVEEKFAFLFVGQWVKGGFGEDRKDIYRTIRQGRDIR